MKPKLFTRRRFLLSILLGAPVLATTDAKWLEPKWLKTRRIRLSPDKPTHRIVHFTDIHHKGDRAYLRSVVDLINGLSPDFVCFTGDLIEQGKFLPEALELLSAIKSPMYGVPGNHDYWSKVPFDGIARCFAASGGAWLLDEPIVSADAKFLLTGAAFMTFKHQPLRLDAARRNIFLLHDPAWVDKLAVKGFDLILAGHSHGGQVRLPFYGPVFVPFGVEQYDLGLFRTPAGPLYVNPGIGWYPVPIRFNCRPEITVFEM